jgi:uncharacterized protein (TIGR02391 family)
MTRRGTRPESMQPTLTPYRAIELLKQKKDQLETILALKEDDPEVKKWMNTTSAILDATFGKPNGERHEMAAKFNQYGMSLMNKSEQYYESEHQKRMLQRRGILESCIEQLEILAPPAAQIAPGQYMFHSEIERVSGKLLRDGHYKQAALEAFIRVIEEVKTKSGLDFDGDSLMNHAFGCENRVPAIPFNLFTTEAERDEQKGFMFLFKGVVGLRNSKAHSNQLFSDPHRAQEYLALASLLMRILESRIAP